MRKTILKYIFLSFFGIAAILLITKTELFYDYLNQYKAFTLSKQSLAFQEKVWAHRVNSIGKAREAVRIFKGIEIDVVFDKKTRFFDVNHPPDQSINLSLETLLASLPSPLSHLSFWLDCKNLNKGNVDKSVTRLIQLCFTFNIPRSSIIVESGSPELLSEFSKHDFKTSYYLPTTFLSQLKEKNYNNLTTIEQNSLTHLKQVINQSQFDYISTYSEYYFFISKLLNTKKSILLWNVGLEPHKYFDRKQIKKILSYNKNIEVLLVQLSSKYDR